MRNVPILTASVSQSQSLDVGHAKLKLGRHPVVLYGFTSSLSVSLCRSHISRLREKGLDVAIVSSPGAELFRIGAEERVRTFAVPICREIAPFSDLRAIYRLWKLLIKLCPTVTNFGTPKAGLLGGIAAKLARVPCQIYTLHGLRCETARGSKRLLLSVAEWIACHCAHRVICVSASLKARAVQLRLIGPENIVVLGQGTCSGIDAAAFQDSATDAGTTDSLRRALDIPNSVPVVGFVGRFTRDKGIPELVDAYDRLRSRMPTLRLLLVGDFEDGDPVSEATRVRILGDPNIVQAGFVSDVAPYYHLMDVLGLPTYREGFGLVTLEAAAAGKPVVTTNATGAIDSVVDGITGLIVPVGDSRALAVALERLLSDPSLRERMGVAGRERVIREFQPNRVVGALIDEYRERMPSKSSGVCRPIP